MNRLLKQKVVLLLVLAACVLPGAVAQQVDTIYVRSGANVLMQIDWKPNNYGTIQWQRSSTKGASWATISGATNPTYECAPSEIYLYRAKIQTQKECTPTYITKAMKVVTFTITVSKQKTNSIEFLLSNVDFRGAKVVEYGFCYNNTKLNTRSLLEMNKLKVGTQLPDTNYFKISCTGLLPATSYNIRNYFKLSDGTVIYSASKTVTTAIGLKWSSENWILSKTSVGLRFEMAGYTGAEPEMSLFFGPTSDSLTAQTINKLGSFKYSSNLISGLKANKAYIAQVKVKLSDSIHVFTKQVKTLSDYSSFVVSNPSSGITHKIVWDTTRHQISPVGLKTEYPRIIRVNKDTLLCCYHGGAADYWVNIYLQKSYDNGKTWQAPTIILDKENSTLGQSYWRFTNPELTKLKNGWIIMAVTANGNPETNDNCHVMVLTSKDNGESWSDPVIVGRGRSWEPKVLQLPNGELELLVSSEARWWGTGATNIAQEIVYARSTDNGETWTKLLRASYSPDRRDGMPVGFVMQGNKGVLYCIEIVNDNGWGSPTFVRRALTEEWDSTAWNNANTAKRWHIPMGAYGGAPYTIQLPTGEIVVSAHANGRTVWQTSYPRIVMADNNGKIFTSPTIPITNLPATEGMYYNSLFLKDDTTIWLVVTHATYDATGATRLKGEIKYIEGKISLK